MKHGLFLVLMLAALLPATSATAMKEWRLPFLDDRPVVGCEFPDFGIPDTQGNLVWFKDFQGTPLSGGVREADVFRLEIAHLRQKDAVQLPVSGRVPVDLLDGCALAGEENPSPGGRQSHQCF